MLAINSREMKWSTWILVKSSRDSTLDKFAIGKVGLRKTLFWSKTCTNKDTNWLHFSGIYFWKYFYLLLNDENLPLGLGLAIFHYSVCFGNKNFLVLWENSLSIYQWRTSVKIIGGDETEPSKVARIKKRIWKRDLGNKFVISAQKQVVSKKKKKGLHRNWVTFFGQIR